MQNKLLIRAGHPRLCRSLRHDQRSLPHDAGLQHASSIPGYVPPELGNVDVLLWHAGRPLSHDLRAAEVQHGPHHWQLGLSVGSDLYAHRSRHELARPLRATLLPGLCGEHYPDRLYVHYQLLLHAEGTSAATELVVLLHRAVHHHRRRD